MQVVFDLLATSAQDCLLIGGHALASYGLVRQTIDIDLLIAADNLSALGVGLQSLGYSERARTRTAVRYSATAPALPDVDVLLVDRDTFQKLRNASRPISQLNTHLLVPSLAHLIALKLHAIRNDPRREVRDFGDIAELLRLNPQAITRDELQAIARQFASPALRDKLLALP